MGITGILPEIPIEAYDVHTKVGRRRGLTKDDFFISEFDALKPRQAGLFDYMIDDLKKS